MRNSPHCRRLFSLAAARCAVEAEGESRTPSRSRPRADGPLGDIPEDDMVVGVPRGQHRPIAVEGQRPRANRASMQGAQLGPRCDIPQSDGVVLFAAGGEDLPVVVERDAADPAGVAAQDLRRGTAGGIPQPVVLSALADPPCARWAVYDAAARLWPRQALASRRRSAGRAGGTLLALAKPCAARVSMIDSRLSSDCHQIQGSPPARSSAGGAENASAPNRARVSAARQGGGGGAQPPYTPMLVGRLAQ